MERLLGPDFNEIGLWNAIYSIYKPMFYDNTELNSQHQTPDQFHTLSPIILFVRIKPNCQNVAISMLVAE